MSVKRNKIGFISYNAEYLLEVHVGTLHHPQPSPDAV